MGSRLPPNFIPSQSTRTTAEPQLSLVLAIFALQWPRASHVRRRSQGHACNGRAPPVSALAKAAKVIVIARLFRLRVFPGELWRLLATVAPVVASRGCWRGPTPGPRSFARKCTKRIVQIWCLHLQGAALSREHRKENRNGALVLTRVALSQKGDGTEHLSV